MAIATIVVLLFLFNRMMNVISMMDNFDTNVISTQVGTLLYPYFEQVAVMMSSAADQEHSIFLFLSMAVTILPAQNCKGLYFTAYHPVWMMVCLVRHVHNPTRLADLYINVDNDVYFPNDEDVYFHSDDVHN
jgi:hypothetical protein